MRVLNSSYIAHKITVAVSANLINNYCYYNIAINKNIIRSYKIMKCTF